MRSVFEWLYANRLSINATKTEFIFFKLPKKLLNQRIVLTLNGTKIFESPKIKYLGVILDPFLRWNHHIYIFFTKGHPRKGPWATTSTGVTGTGKYISKLPNIFGKAGNERKRTDIK